MTSKTVGFFLPLSIGLEGGAALAVVGAGRETALLGLAGVMVFGVISVLQDLEPPPIVDAVVGQLSVRLEFDTRDVSKVPVTSENRLVTFQCRRRDRSVTLSDPGALVLTTSSHAFPEQSPGTPGDTQRHIH